MWRKILTLFQTKKQIEGLMGRRNKFCKESKDGFWSKLIKEDTNVSVMNFFLMCTLAVGVILLFIPAVGMITDIWFNHTITINMADLGTYIMAVAGIFAAGGLSSAWTEFAYSKYNVSPITEEDMARAEINAEMIRDENENGIPDENE